MSQLHVDGPCLVILVPDNPAIRIDVRLIDAIEVDVEEVNLVLTVEDLDVGIYVADGREVATRLAEQLGSYTRTGVITRPDAYEDAKRRHSALPGSFGSNAEARAENEIGVGVGITRRGGYIHVGSVAFATSDVQHYAENGANLPLPNKQMLQAAVALLLVAAEERALRGEDQAHLARRIAAYEALQAR